MIMYITGKLLGGEAGLFGGEASPLPPPVDRTLNDNVPGSSAELGYTVHQWQVQTLLNVCSSKWITS